MAKAILVITDYKEMKTETFQFDSVESARVKMNEDFQEVMDSFEEEYGYDNEYERYIISENYARFIDMADEFANVEWNIVEIK